MALQEEDKLVPVAACKEWGSSQRGSEGLNPTGWWTTTAFTSLWTHNLPSHTVPTKRRNTP